VQSCSLWNQDGSGGARQKRLGWPQSVTDSKILTCGGKILYDKFLYIIFSNAKVLK